MRELCRHCPANQNQKSIAYETSCLFFLVVLLPICAVQEDHDIASVTQTLKGRLTQPTLPGTGGARIRVTPCSRESEDNIAKNGRIVIR